MIIRMFIEDLREELPKIKQPCLLIWGENDEQTPLADGKLMAELIPDAGLVVLPNSSHFAFFKDFSFKLCTSGFCLYEPRTAGQDNLVYFEVYLTGSEKFNNGATTI